MVRRFAARIAGVTPSHEPATASRPTYQALYEDVAASTGDEGVGAGDYDAIGEIELDVLRAEGLGPTSRLLDFGCGNGRLAVHAVPYLRGGAYIGTDIAPTFLDGARRRLAPAMVGNPCDVRLLHQSDEHLDLPDHSVDIACAFSVFTHMEHEDMYRYLVQIKRVVRPGGTMVISCLPMDLDDARQFFLREAALDPVARWQRVRNITTSVDLVDAIAALAGWTVVRWLPAAGGQALSAAGEMRGLGQSVVVLGT